MFKRGIWLTCTLILLLSLNFTYAKASDSKAQIVSNLNSFVERYNSFVKNAIETDDVFITEYIDENQFNIDYKDLMADYKSETVSLSVDFLENGEYEGFRLSVDIGDLGLSENEQMAAYLNAFAVFRASMEGIDPNITEDQTKDLIGYLFTNCKWELWKEDARINSLSYDAYIVSNLMGLTAKVV